MNLRDLEKQKAHLEEQLHQDTARFELASKHSAQAIQRALDLRSRIVKNPVRLALFLGLGAFLLTQRALEDSRRLPPP
ncbi:MAG: hypothetical protein ACO3A2_09060 [Bdellovibrionia bacterium]